VPETPRYLALNHNDEKALNILTKVNGLDKARIVLAEIKETVHEKVENVLTYGWKVLIIGILLSVFQQAVGINVFFIMPQPFSKAWFWKRRSYVANRNYGCGEYYIYAGSHFYCGQIRPETFADYWVDWNGSWNVCYRNFSSFSNNWCKYTHLYCDLHCGFYDVVGTDLLGVDFRDFP
jgi:hypothetical protein